MRLQCSSTSFPQKFLPHIYHHRLPLETKETKILESREKDDSSTMDTAMRKPMHQ